MSTCTCFSANADAESRSRKIDNDLRKEKKRLKRQVKILLLGSGESGKSTFIKQMVIIHGRGEFTAEEVRQYRHLIYQNVIQGIRVLIDAREKLSEPWQNPSRTDGANQLLALNTTAEPIDQRHFSQLAPIVADLWKDEGIQQTFAKRNLFQISDSCKYFFEHINRVSQPDYIPSNRDILLCRKATRSITEYPFDIQRVPFMFVDVGGQRSQRNKWFQCFTGITSILFMVSSCEYDQVILEDRRTNRVVESRSVFDVIVNHRCFEAVSVILFMNKTDLLKEKVPISDISTYFPQFNGNPRRLEDVQKFLLTYFDSVRRDQHKTLYCHFTTAVDTENIRRVFKDVKETILDLNLKSLMMT